MFKCCGSKILSKRVVLIRHGQSSWNLKNLIQGTSDASILTDLGITQAQKTAQALAQVDFCTGFVSPLTRARHTAQIIWGERTQTMTVLEPLKEIHLPQWQGLTAQEAEAQYPEQFAQYTHHPELFAMAGRLPLVDLWQQAHQSWEQILAASGTCLLVVAHNAINQALLCTALGLGPEHFRTFRQNNCAVSVLNISEPGSAQLESMNQTAHLVDQVDFTTKPGTTRILLIRHGETNWNREGRFQGQMDIPLNDTGILQAQKTAQLLASTKIHQIISSPLKRPYQTAQAILEQHPVSIQTIDALQEISHGTWEGKLHAQVETEYPGQLDRWATAPETVQMPEGEDLVMVWKRATQAWVEILERATGTTTVVVAHDAINKAILCQLVGLGPPAFWRFKQGNGAVTVIDYPQGIGERPVLNCVNFTTHLGGGVFDCTAQGAL